jgi:hypothetical protein
VLAPRAAFHRMMTVILSTVVTPDIKAITNSQWCAVGLPCRSYNQTVTGVIALSGRGEQRRDLADGQRTRSRRGPITSSARAFIAKN